MRVIIRVKEDGIMFRHATQMRHYVKGSTSSNYRHKKRQHPDEIIHAGNSEINQFNILPNIWFIIHHSSFFILHNEMKWVVLNQVLSSIVPIFHRKQAQPLEEGTTVTSQYDEGAEIEMDDTPLSAFALAGRPISNIQLGPKNLLLYDAQVGMSWSNDNNDNENEWNSSWSHGIAFGKSGEWDSLWREYWRCY